MKPILLTILIVFFPSLQQVEREEPDLLVVKFSWAKEQQRSRMIRGAQNPGGPIMTPMPSENRDLSSRKVDLRNVDKAAVNSTEKPADNYELRLEVKNTGSKVIRSLIWEFKPTAGPDDYQPKQYLCALQVKGNEKKILELWTPYAPVKVINVDARKDALKDGEVVINQIEYTDGSVWKKHRWNFRLPAEASKKLSEGTCSVF